MALFDKMKEAKDKAAQMAGSAAEKTKDAYGKAKEAHEEKKAEKEAYEAEMKEKAAAEAKARAEQIEAGFSGTPYFDGISDDQLMRFTKDFFDKIVLPASSLEHTCIEMYPHIDDRSLKKIKKTFPDYDDGDIALVYLREKKGSEILICQKELLFSDTMSEDSKYHVTGEIQIDRISGFESVQNDSICALKVNGVDVFTLEKSPVFERDFVSLHNFFNMIEKRDFEITDEETDAIIREKIGAKIYQDVKNKMQYDDEIMLYFSWGVDSLSAKDYIVCTDKQVIYLDREALGATANVKQFYYEDITGMATLQNSNDSSLTGYLIDTALTAALAICDLEITVAGNRLVIHNLKKLEADRIVEVYHQQRKKAKDAANQPQVIVQQAASEPDALEQLEKLNKLKEAGILSEEEFNAKKADLLAKI